MRFKRVILISPYYSNSIFTMPVLPVGLGYISENLRKNRIAYRIVDLTLGHRSNFLRKQIYDFRPDLIGFSMMSFMYKDVYKAIVQIKREFPNIKIVVGGPHLSSLREAVLKECQDIDFGVLQEGEETMVELCLGTELENIKGLLYRENGAIRFNGPRETLWNLDTLNFPTYEHFELNKYGFGISIVSSRGCPYKCIFCAASSIRKEYRVRSPKNIVEEINYWYKRGYREFDLQEDNPTFHRERAFELCDEIQKMGYKDLVIMCGNGVRADRVDKKLLARMKEVGFKRLAFGVEAGNNKVLTSLKKGEKIEVIKEAIQNACELGFFVSIFFVVGSPTETIQDVQDSIDIALKYPISNVSFYNLIPLPGTELFDWVQKNNYFIIKPEIYLNKGGRMQMGTVPVFATPEFSAGERKTALKKVKRIERYIKRRVIENKLPKAYPLNKLIAWVYTLNLVRYIEEQLIHYEIFRKTIGLVRNRIRLLFYKI